MVTTLKIHASSFSLLGTKSLEFSENRDRFIAFSDTGGVFSEKVSHVLSFDEFCENAVILVAKGLPGLVGKVEFGGKQWVIFEPLREAGTEQLLKLICEWAKPNQMPVMFFPSRIEPGELARFKEVYKPDSFDASSLLSVDHNKLYFDKGCVPIGISTKDGTISVQVLNYEPAQFPASALRIVSTDSGLKCQNTFLVGDREIRGFTMEFPAARVAKRVQNDLGAVQQDETPAQGLVGLIGQVHVEGVIGGQTFPKMACDARIEERELTVLQKGTGAPLWTCRFDSRNLAIDGTAQEFVISSDGSTILRITSEAKPFLRALFSNNFVQEAATRSSNIGPFVAANHEGQLVRIDDSGATVILTTNGGQPVELAQQLPQPRLDVTGKKPSLKLGDYGIFGELPTLEGIAAKLTGVNLRGSVTANFPETLGRILGLEGQFLTFCVFGRLAEAHLSIASALSLSENATFALTASKQDKETFLAMMGQFAGPWSREIETVIHYLAPFVVNRDRELLEAAGLASQLNYGRAEIAYQQAMGVCSALATHLFRIEGTMNRFSSLKSGSAKGEGWMTYAPLGAQVVGALTVNPLMAVGALQQASSIYARKTATSALSEEATAEVFDCCSQEWDFVIHTLVPVLSNRFAQLVYPLRLTVSHVLSKAYENGDAETKQRLDALVAQRLARLTTFLEFPASAGAAILRGRCVDFLLKRQRHAQGLYARYF
jgi:hypothetical protein